MRKLIKAASAFLSLSLLFLISGCSDEKNLDDQSLSQAQEYNEFRNEVSSALKAGQCTCFYERI